MWRRKKKIILRNSTEFIIDTGRHYWNAIDNWTNMAGMLCHWTFLSSFWKTSQHRVGTGVSVHPRRVHVTQSNLPLCLRFRRSSRPELGLLFRVFFFAVSHYAFTLKKKSVSVERLGTFDSNFILHSSQSDSFHVRNVSIFYHVFSFGGQLSMSRSWQTPMGSVSIRCCSHKSYCSRQPRCCSSLWHNIVT